MFQILLAIIYLSFIGHGLLPLPETGVFRMTIGNGFLSWYLLLILLEYIPFFLGFGPGADLLFSSTFGGPFMSLMIVFVPQVIVFSLICTYTYRKTGNVYTGASLVAILACWIVTGGSAIL